MKIAVCIKQVPTRDWQPKLTDDRSWIREQDATYEMNEPDAYALEEALRLREKHSGEVVVCSAGPARVQQVIREALARGADRAIHVEDETLGAADAMVAASALAAAMNDEQFDLVLTDVNMPLMDGITLTRELRTLPAYRFVPILILTTEAGPERKQEGKAAGATGWIVKPFNPDQLIAVVKKVLG